MIVYPTNNREDRIIRHATRWALGTSVALLTLLFALSSGCALHINPVAETNLTHVQGRVGLKDATLIDFDAALPPVFDAEVNSDVGSWLVARALEASTAGGNVLLDFVKWVGRWFKIAP